MSIARLMSGRPATFAIVLGVALFAANVIALPRFVTGGQLPETLGTLAPFAIAGMASTPAFLSGGGGIDLSIAPLMGFINIILVTELLGTPFGRAMTASCFLTGPPVGDGRFTLSPPRALARR